MTVVNQIFYKFSFFIHFLKKKLTYIWSIGIISINFPIRSGVNVFGSEERWEGRSKGKIFGQLKGILFWKGIIYSSYVVYNMIYIMFGITKANVLLTFVESRGIVVYVIDDNDNRDTGIEGIARQLISGKYL